MGIDRRIIAVLAVVVIAAACSSSSDAGDSDEPGEGDTVGSSTGTYEATITRTTGGVPHIRAKDRPSVTFGQGWAGAEDHACSLSDQILKVFSRRAEFLGAGDDDENITSDFAWLNIGLADLAAQEWPNQSDDTRELITAYADGWNAHLEQVGSDGLSGWCAGEEWVTPIEPVELYTYARSIALNASSNRLTSFIGAAEPPTTDSGGAEPLPLARRPLDAPPDLGSNGWAIGSERTEDGTAMLLANPHFPWEGELRFWEVHLEVEDGTSIYGAQLTGLPGVGIGFTDGVAWTHTVSAGNRFTAYTLDLVEGDPTSYLYDGETADDGVDRGDDHGARRGRRTHRGGDPHHVPQPLRPDPRLPRSRVDRGVHRHLPRRQHRQRRDDRPVRGDGRGRRPRRTHRRLTAPTRGSRSSTPSPRARRAGLVRRHVRHPQPVRRDPRRLRRDGSRATRSRRPPPRAGRSCSTGRPPATSGSMQMEPATPASFPSRTCLNWPGTTTSSTPTTASGWPTPRN